MKNLNRIILNFVLPVLLLFFAFRFNAGLGWIIILCFLLYGLFVSRYDIYAHIGNSNYIKGNEEAAFKWIKKAANHKSCKPRIIAGYAFLLLKRELIDEAEKNVERIINGNYPADEKNNAKTYLGLVEWKKGRPMNGITLLQEVYTNFKNTNLYSNLGFLLTLRGNWEKSLEFNEEAYEYNSTNSIIVNNLGTTYLALNRYDKACEIYEALLKNNPNFAEPYYYYGIALLELNKKEEAIQSIKKSLNYRTFLQSTLTIDKIKNKIEELAE